MAGLPEANDALRRRCRELVEIRRCLFQRGAGFAAIAGARENDRAHRRPGKTRRLAQNENRDRAGLRSSSGRRHRAAPGKSRPARPRFPRNGRRPQIPRPSSRRVFLRPRLCAPIFSAAEKLRFGRMLAATSSGHLRQHAADFRLGFGLGRREQTALNDFRRAHQQFAEQMIGNVGALRDGLGQRAVMLRAFDEAANSRSRKIWRRDCPRRFAPHCGRRAKPERR